MYCPNCGSKNTEQVAVNIIKCKKCKHYNRIDLVGIDVINIQTEEIKKQL